jgi:GxxExxY protein
MQERGLTVEREYPIVVHFHGRQIGFQRVDMLINRRVIIEIKSTERLAEGARRQLRCYLRTLNLDLGMLLHFGARPEFHRELAGRKLARSRENPGSSGQIRAE